MGKLTRRSIIPIVLLLLLSTFQWTVSAHKHHHKHDKDHGKYDKPRISTPEECNRECHCKEKPRICYYKFVVEHYMSLSGACTSNETMSQCVYGDGTQKPLLTINRQLPGPKIVVCKGDHIVVDVENKVPAQGTTIHWHGVYQTGTPFYDGVPLLTQCPISEGSTFRYNFVANNSGTHMYHSHDGLQMMDGMSGALIVRDPKCTEPNWKLYNVDEYSIVLTDMFKDDAGDHFPGKRDDSDATQTAVNMFMNGKGINVGPNREAAVPPVVEEFVVEHGLTYRFRVENLCSTVCLAKFLISSHRLTLIALDGESMKPITVDHVDSGSGMRFDVLVNATQKVGTYWIYLLGLGECRGTVWQIAKLVYRGSTGPVIPQPKNYYDIPVYGVTFNPENITGCLEHSRDSVCVYQATCAEGKIPHDILYPPEDNHYVIPAVLGFDFPEKEEIFRDDHYDRYFAATMEGVPTSSIINNISNIDAPSPPLTQKAGYTAPITNHCPSVGCFGRQVYRVPENAVVTLVMCDKPGYADLNHPMHLHGHSFHVLGQGYSGGGTCTPEDLKRIVKEVDHRIRRGENPCPAKVDTTVVPQGGYTVGRFIANNLGMWLFHCHFTWHHLTGMSMVIQVGDRSQFPPVPPGFPTCGDFLPPI